jgi:Flp pilus assembly protein TadD
MLYNIVPPLLFFGSFGGVIVILSRVLLRVRRQQTAAAMDQQSAIMQKAPDNLLMPATPGLQVMKSRMHVFASVGKKAVSSIRNIRLPKRQPVAETPPAAEEASSGMRITMPTANWKEKIMETVAAGRKKTVEVASGAVAKVRARRQAKLESMQVEEEAVPAPEIRVMRVDKAEPPQAVSVPAAEEDKEIPAAMLEPVAKSFMAQLLKREQPLSIYDKAAQAMESEDFQKVEDLLVPHILEHTRDTKAYMLLGRAALARGNYPDAMEVFQQVVKLNPHEAGAQAGLGLAAFQEGKFTVAVQALQRARDDGQADGEVLQCLLAIAQRMDNKILQRSLLQELLEMYPENQEYAAHLAALSQPTAA